MEHVRVRHAQCRDCPEPIFFAKTAGGARIPINAKGDPEGNVVVQQGPDGEVLARVLKKDEEQPDGWHGRFTAHFTTCPEAAKHRRRK